MMWKTHYWLMSADFLWCLEWWWVELLWD